MVHHFVLSGEVLPLSDGESNDVVVTHRALKTIEAHANSGADVDVEDCGAAYRFMMALLAVTPGRWRLTGTSRLLQRPMDELVWTLRSMGAEICRETDGWQIVGRGLSAQTLKIDCCRSSQYASALLLIAPKLGLKTLHLCPENVGSLPYIQLTRLITRSAVAVPELPPVEGTLGRMGDWSAALFWYAKVLLEPENQYLLKNLSLDSAQGDAVIARWFAEMGVCSSETTEGVLISVPKERRLSAPYVFDVGAHPDVVPVMSALACLLPADFTFVHTKNLAHKESNRVRNLSEQLSVFADVKTQEDEFRVIGKSKSVWPFPPYRFQTHNDHRLAMAFLLFGATACVDDTSCLCKSYPDLLSFC